MTNKTAYKQETVLYNKKVEHTGFEPVASTMRMLRAPNCANAPWVTNLQKNYSTHYGKWNKKFGKIAFSFYKKFGAMNTEDLEDLRPLFTRDIAKSVRDGMSDKNLKDKVEETLFFYPIREILCAIGGNNKMLEPEDE